MGMEDDLAKKIAEARKRAETMAHASTQYREAASRSRDTGFANPTLRARNEGVAERKEELAGVIHDLETVLDSRSPESNLLSLDSIIKIRDLVKSEIANHIPDWKDPKSSGYFRTDW